jgi:hypothetical protein
MITGRRKWVVVGVLIINLFSVLLDNTVLKVALGEPRVATQSLAATQSAAARLGHGREGLASLAERSFVHAIHVTTVFWAVIAASGGVLIAMWMPGRRVHLGHTRTDLPNSDRQVNVPVAVLMED